MNTTARPATQKQRDFIERLLGEKDTTGTAYEGWTPDWSRATSRTASTVIDFLLTLPKRTAPAAPAAAEVTPGVYVIHGDEYVRVYHGQQSGKMLVKRINMEQDGDTWTVHYEYLGSADRVLVPAATPERLSLEEVGSLGITTNHCLMCGRRLDDPESVDRGIGPVCAAKYDGPAEATVVDEPLPGIDPDACSPGQKCDPANLRLCSKHSMQYQNRYGRAYNE